MDLPPPSPNEDRAPTAAVEETGDVVTTVDRPSDDDRAMTLSAVAGLIEPSKTDDYPQIFEEHFVAFGMTPTSTMKDYVDAIQRDVDAWYAAVPSDKASTKSFDRRRTAMAKALDLPEVRADLGEGAAVRFLSVIRRAWKRNKQAYIADAQRRKARLAAPNLVIPTTADGDHEDVDVDVEEDVHVARPEEVEEVEEVKEVDAPPSERPPVPNECSALLLAELQRDNAELRKEMRERDRIIDHMFDRLNAQQASLDGLTSRLDVQSCRMDGIGTRLDGLGIELPTKSTLAHL